MIRIALLVLSTLALSACASTISSTGSGVTPRNGDRIYAYALPETRLLIGITADGGASAEIARNATAATNAAERAARATRPVYTISGAEVSLVHTERHQFQLRYHPSSGSSDTLKVDPNDDTGFLESVELNRDDRTTEIVTELSSLTRALASQLPSTERTAERSATQAIVDRVSPFNPDDPAELAEANVSLARYGLSARTTGFCAQSETPPPQSSEVLYYARRTPRLLEIVRGQQVVSIVQYVTTNCGLGAFDIGDFDWVDSKLKLTFSDGVLTGVEITKPSEAEEAVNLPLVVVNDILGIARDLLTVRFQRIDSESDVLNAQRENYAAQTQMLQAYQALATAIAEARAAETAGQEDPRPTSSTTATEPETGSDGVDEF